MKQPISSRIVKSLVPFANILVTNSVGADALFPVGHQITICRRAAFGCFRVGHPLLQPWPSGGRAVAERWPSGGRAARGAGRGRLRVSGGHRRRPPGVAASRRASAVICVRPRRHGPLCGVRAGHLRPASRAAPHACHPRARPSCVNCLPGTVAQRSPAREAATYSTAQQGIALIICPAYNIIR